FSGSAHDDVLKGDNATAAILATAGVNGSILTNFDLINGLRALVGEAAAGPDGMVGTFDDRFDGGNIIIGGAGSDNIEGRGGDDLIDGDAWLNVRIGVRATVDANNDGIADRDPITGELILGDLIPNVSFNSMVPMIPFMVNGTYDPGQLQIVREILYSPTPDFDTAKFRGNLFSPGPDGLLGTPDDVANYTIRVNGNLVDPLHLPIINGTDIVTVTDISAKPID